MIMMRLLVTMVMILMIGGTTFAVKAQQCMMNSPSNLPILQTISIHLNMSIFGGKRKYMRKNISIRDKSLASAVSAEHEPKYSINFVLPILLYLFINQNEQIGSLFLNDIEHAKYIKNGDAGRVCFTQASLQLFW